MDLKTYIYKYMHMQPNIRVNALVIVYNNNNNNCIYDIGNNGIVMVTLVLILR